MEIWTDREIQRFTKRAAAFARDGLPEADAENLAEQLWERDRGLDDRRVCYECRFYKASNGWCKKFGRSTLRFTMQRCPGFELKMSSEK